MSIINHVYINENKIDSSIINVILPGINQIYYVNKDSLTYKSLSYLIIEELRKNSSIKQDLLSSFEEMTKSNSDYVYNGSYGDFVQKIDKTWNTNIINLIYSTLQNNQFFIKNITFTNHFGLFPKNKFNVIIFNKNPFYLLIDEVIIHHFCVLKEGIDNICFKTFKELESDPLKLTTFVLDYEVNTLTTFAQKFKYWTVLLNTYSFCQKEMDTTTEENKICSSITNYFLKNEKDLYGKSPYLINENIHFISNNYFQLAFFYELIGNKFSFSSSYNDLCNYLNNDLKPKIVLIFTRSLVRKQEFLKQKYYISNNTVLYKSFVNAKDKISINGKFDWIISKAVEVKDMLLYKETFDNIVKYVSSNNDTKMVNDITKFQYFVEKTKQEELLLNFVSSPEVKELEKEYSINIKVPNSMIISLDKMVNDPEIFSIFTKQNINFPIILKYKGESTFFKHLVTIIFNDKGFSNFSKFANDLIKQNNSAMCVVQSFVNHGDYVLKIYHINKKNYIDYRSSLVDVDDKSKVLEEFKMKLYWNFKTIELESETYIDNIWKKYRKENYIKNIIESDPNKKEFVDKICNLFANFSNVHFLGTDLLYDYVKKEIYLIDVNALPSYKIKNFNHAEEIRKFLVENK